MEIDGGTLKTMQDNMGLIPESPPAGTHNQKRAS